MSKRENEETEKAGGKEGGRTLTGDLVRVENVYVAGSRRKVCDQINGAYTHLGGNWKKNFKRRAKTGSQKAWKRQCS